jgi:hypothetical protein
MEINTINNMKIIIHDNGDNTISITFSNYENDFQVYESALLAVPPGTKFKIINYEDLPTEALGDFTDSINWDFELDNDGVGMTDEEYVEYQKNKDK